MCPDEKDYVRNIYMRHMCTVDRSAINCDIHAKYTPSKTGFPEPIETILHLCMLKGLQYLHVEQFVAVLLRENLEYKLRTNRRHKTVEYRQRR